MKKTIILFLLVFSGIDLYSQNSLAIPVQEVTPRMEKIFKATIYGYASRVNKGILFEVNDSSVVLSQSASLGDMDTLQRIGYSDIRTIKLKRTNSIPRGAGRGFLIGGGVGLGTGLVMTSIYSLFGGQNGFAIITGYSTATGAIIGTVIGVLVGAFRKHSFKINGSKEKLRVMQMNMIGSY